MHCVFNLQRTSHVMMRSTRKSNLRYCEERNKMDCLLVCTIRSLRVGFLKLKYTIHVTDSTNWNVPIWTTKITGVISSTIFPELFVEESETDSSSLKAPLFFLISASYILMLGRTEVFTVLDMDKVLAPKLCLLAKLLLNIIPED